LHVCYCHSPARYLWDQKEIYLSNSSLITKTGYSLFHSWLRRWDIRTAKNVDIFIANSNFIKDRIKNFWGREAQVIPPPVDVETFKKLTPGDSSRFLFMGALVPYKKPDTVVEAFNRLKLPLDVVGDGPLKKSLKKIAGSTVKIHGWVSDKDRIEFIRNCKALVFDGVEDFGITFVEAQAAGKPVIAFNKGGVRDIIVPWDEINNQGTGILFSQTGITGIINAVKKFQSFEEVFLPSHARKVADKYTKNEFITNFKKLLIGATEKNECKEKRNIVV